MSIDSQTPDSRELTSTGALGQLRIEVPHWSAEVRVFDNLFRPVPLSPSRPSDATSRVYVIEAELPAGVYDVQVRLGDEVARKSLVVRPGKRPATFSAKDCGELGLNVDPTMGTAATPAPDIAAAEYWSRQSTWSAAPGGDSRLFVFVRSEGPTHYPNFARGLALRSTSATMLTIELGGARTETLEGWMAFTADLPSGYYVLSREQGSEGVPAREQPIYLSPGWETHAFIPAREYPSLGALTLSLARLGRGYVPDNSLALATKAVFDALRRGTGGRRLVTKDHMGPLITGEHADPWLGVLAGYVLVQSLKEAGWTQQNEEERESAYDFLRDLGQHLERTIGDHPDVAALNLAQPERTASYASLGSTARSFPNPPLLRLGLRLVQRHATRDVNAIPPDSLTDSVLRRLLTNSPWTAWRPSKEAVSVLRAADRDSKSGKGALVRSVLASQAMPSKAPIYRFEQRIDPPSQLESLSLTAASDVAVAQPSEIRRDATLIRLGQLLDERSAKGLPDKIVFDEQGMVDELLSRTSPEDISKECGISLAETKRGWQALRGSGEPSAVLERAVGDQSTRSSDDLVMAAVQKSILTCALAKRFVEPLESPIPGGISNARMPTDSSAFSIEDAVRDLRDVAELLEMDSATRVTDALDRAERVRKLSDELMRRAAIVAITDSQEQILSGNGALLTSLASAERPEAIAERRSMWEAALAAATPGRSTIADPQGRPNTWTLDRTVVEDAQSGRVRSYLNVLHQSDAPTIKQDALDKIEASLARLTLAASLYAYGSDEGRASHLSDVEIEVDNLQGHLERGDIV